MNMGELWPHIKELLDEVAKRGEVGDGAEADDVRYIIKLFADAIESCNSVGVVATAVVHACKPHGPCDGCIEEGVGAGLSAIATDWKDTDHE